MICAPKVESEMFDNSVPVFSTDADTMKFQSGGNIFWLLGQDLNHRLVLPRIMFVYDNEFD